jgi:hypothetical protein
MAVTTIEPARQGGNNRLYCINTSRGRFAMKSYPRSATDLRDRLGAETAAIRFMSECGINSALQLHAADPDLGVAIFSWIDGNPVEPIGQPDIDSALNFLRALHDHRTESAAAELAWASEACLSGEILAAQVRRRFEKLAALNDPLLCPLLEDDLWPVLARFEPLVSRDPHIARVDQTLSPSDFGFHNALRKADGGLVFLDFEYFGWDDPVKLTADTILHPGMTLTTEQGTALKAGLVDLYKSASDFSARLERHFPLYVLRWCAIMLNEFLPAGWARRQQAGALDHGAAKIRQLAKVRDFLERHSRALGT